MNLAVGGEHRIQLRIVRTDDNHIEEDAVWQAKGCEPSVEGCGRALLVLVRLD